MGMLQLFMLFFFYKAIHVLVEKLIGSLINYKKK